MSSKYTILVQADLNSEASSKSIQATLKTIGTDPKTILTIANIDAKEAIKNLKTQIESELKNINIGLGGVPSSGGGNRGGGGTSSIGPMPYDQSLPNRSGGDISVRDRMADIEAGVDGASKLDFSSTENSLGNITSAVLRYKDAIGNVITETYKLVETTGELALTTTKYSDSESRLFNKEQQDIRQTTQGIQTLHTSYENLNAVKRNIMDASIGGVGVVDNSALENAQNAARNYEQIIEEVKSHGSIISAEDNQKLVIAKQEMDQMNGALKEEITNLNGVVQARLKDQASIQKQLADAQKTIDSNNALMKNKSVNNSLVRDTIKADQELAAAAKEVALAEDTIARSTEGQNKALKNAQVNADNAGKTLRGAGKDANSWTHEIDIAIKRTIEWAEAMTLIYGTIRQIQQGIQFIKDLNKELVAIQIVTGSTNQEAQKMAATFNDLAKATGTTTASIAAGSSEWLFN